MTAPRRQGRWWVFPDGRRLPVIAGGTLHFTTQQKTFRGRHDNGTETTATFIAANNTDWSQQADQTFRIRFVLQETGGASGTFVPQLQRQLNGGGYANVTASSTIVRSVASANVADGVATTTQLGTGTGTFAAGSIDEVDGVTANVNVAASGYTEVEYVVQIRSADTASGDTVNLRIVGKSTAGTVLDTYTVTPALTVFSGNLTDSGTADDELSLPVDDPTVNGTEVTSAAEQWTGSNGAAWDTGRWSVALNAGTVEIQTNEGQITPAGFTGTFATSTAAALADGEVLVRLRRIDATTGQNAKVWLRADTTSGLPANGVYVEYDNGATDSAFVYERVASTNTVIGTLAGSGLTPGTWYWVRFQAEGTTLRGKIWARGTNEPASWQSTPTTNVTAAGRAVLSGHGTGPPIYRFDQFALGDLAGATPKTLEDAGVGANSLEVAAGVPLADAGATTDEVQVAVQVPLAEAGAATDALSVDQGATPKTLTEQGTAADAVSVSTAVPLADTGVGADLLGLAATFSLADSGAGVDSLSVDQGATPKSLTDAGAGADNLQVAAGILLAEQGQAGDQQTVAATIILGDAGAGTDGLDVAAGTATVEIGAIRWVQAEVGTPKTLTDSGVGSDSLQVTAAVSLAEAGSGADSLQVAAQVTLVDSGIGTDSLTVGQFEPKSLTESGTGSDQLRVTAAVLLAEQGAGSDTLRPGAALVLADNGQGVDSVSVLQGIPKTLTDSGTATDSVSVTAQVPLPEQSAGADSLAIHQTRSLTDSGQGTDSLTVGQFVPKTLSDSGIGVDQLLVATSVPLADQGQGSDTLQPAAVVRLTDQGTASDALEIDATAAKVLADSGTAADRLTINRPLDLIDSGQGADTLRPTAVLVLTEEATATDLLVLAALSTLTDSGTGSDAMVVLTVARWIRTTSRENLTTSSSRELAATSSSREPALATSSREQGAP